MLRSSLKTPDYGLNGVVTVSSTATGTNTPSDVLSASDAKSWMKVETSADDSLITDLIASTIDSIEQAYSFQLVEKTVTAEWEMYAKRIDLPLFPAQSVSSVKTINHEGTETTLTAGDDYYLQGDTLILNTLYDYQDPFNRLRLKVVYIAGYTSIPSGIKLGLKKAVLSSYEDRQDLVEGGISELPNGSKSYFKKYAKLI